ncbi:MAG: EF-hand domain-containing protein [Verrucomicrobia bacterium]|nr:EF-hand domain-containing protein [Verrucomicrobiota bacterium]
MNTARIILAATLGIALAGPLAAQDQNPNAARRPFLKGMLFAHMLHKADTDGDGKLSEAERAAAKAKFQENRQEFIAKHDTDGDGTLNDAERAAAKEQITARWKEAKDKFDTNGDGKLDEAERKAAREAWQNRQSR